MNKKVIGITLALVMVLAAVSACAAPVSTPPVTTEPSITPGATSPPVSAPDKGVPTIAPAPSVQGGASTGIATPPVATSPNIAVAAPGGGYVSTMPAFQLNGQAQNYGIMVSGQGMVSAVPDIANLTLGVNVQAASVAAAQTSATNAMNAVMQALKTKGVADKDITTVGFNIYPTYDYRNNTSTITGYQVTNTVTVIVRKISDTGSIIDAVAAAGGNVIQVNSIGFSLSDPTPYLKQARANAMADAKNRASELATLAGVKLGPPTFITDAGGYYPPSPMYYGAVASAKDIATPVSPGETQVSVSVQIVYAIQ
jgi:uncharacterized protein YggE